MPIRLFWSPPSTGTPEASTLQRHAVRPRRWVAALAAPLLCFAGSAWAAHDLVLQHTGPSNAAVTSVATYTVNLNNTHPTWKDTATSVVLTYTYPTANAISAGPARFTNGSGACTESPQGTITCNLADIPYGVSNLKVEFDLYITGAALNSDYVSGVAINPVATVASSGDQVQGNESELVNTTIAAGTDLGVTLTSTPAAPTTLVIGGIWTHDIEVKNHGPLNTTNAKVTLVPPAAGMRWVALSLPSGCAIVGVNVECTVPGTFANGATYDFNGLQAQAIGGGGSSLVVTASVTSSLPDDKSDNNADNKSVEVTPGTDLKLSLGASSGTILAGSPSTITVTPTYTGDVPSNPRFTITIPPALTVNTANPPTVNGWSGCSWSGTTTLTCTTWAGPGVPGADQPMGSVSFPVTGPAGTFDITGNVTSDSNEANMANNSASVPVQFATPTVNVTIAKSGPQAPHNKFTQGATIQYQVTLTNPSSSNVGYWGDLSFTENAPAGLTITGITAPAAPAGTDWACTTSGCSKTYTEADPLPRNTSLVFTVTARVDTDSGVQLVNEVCRAAFIHPLNVSQPQACAAAGSVSGNPDTGGTDLSVGKSVVTAAGSIKAGEWLAYVIDVTNGGTPSRVATNVKVEDTLDNLATGIGSPAASFEITSIPAGWTCTDGGTPLAQGGTVNEPTVNLSCTTATFAANGSAQVAFRIRPLGTIANGDDRKRVNEARVSSDTQEPDFSNNTASVTSDVHAKTDFTIAKVVSNGWDGSPAGSTPGKTGTELQYTVTVSNAGATSGANNVIVTDVLPENVTYLGISGSNQPSCTGVDVNATTTPSAKTLTCTWGTFPGSGDRAFIVRIRPNHEWQGKTLVNDVYVNVEPGTTTPKASTTEETDYTNNHAQASATAGEADIDLQVAKRDTTDPVMVGTNVDYEVIIINNGPSVATNASIYDYLPVKGFTWVGNIKFYEVNASGSRGAEITDPAQGMSCSKTPTAGAHATGGEDKTQPNKLNWLWPMNVTGDTSTNPNYVNGKWDTRIATEADIICNMGTLPSGGKRMLVYTLHAEERGVYMNHAIVRSKEHIDREAQGFADAVWNNDAIQHRTTVRSVPDVDLDKQVSKPTVSVYEPFTYTITVTNKLTAEPAHAPQVRDTLPANMVLTGAPTLTTGAADLTGGTFACNAPPTGPAVPPAVGAASQAGDTAFICTLGTGVKPGAAVTITVPVRVIGGGATTLTNKAALHLDTDLKFDSEPPPAVEDDVPVNVVVSSIAGNVYHDANDNGVKDAGEAPIDGVTITLTGTDDYGNPVTLTATTVGGAYKFDNLAPGNYTVTETHPNTWMDGKDTVGVFGPSPGSGTAGNDVIRAIALPADTHGTEYNFGELRPLPVGQTTASVSGYVYHDVNNDGVKDSGEAPISGVSITLTGSNGDVRTATTDASGFYRFTGLEPGATYTVVETQPGGWTDGKDTAGTVFTDNGGGANDSFKVTPGSGQDGLNWNFGERRTNPPAAIPTLSEWGLIVLSMLLAAFALRRMPLQPGRRM